MRARCSCERGQVFVAERRKSTCKGGSARDEAGRRALQRKTALPCAPSNQSALSLQLLPNQNPLMSQQPLLPQAPLAAAAATGLGRVGRRRRPWLPPMRLVLLLLVVAVSMIAPSIAGRHDDDDHTQLFSHEFTLPEDSVARGLAHVGDGRRIRSVLRALQAGRAVHLGVIGGSITWGHGELRCRAATIERLRTRKHRAAAAGARRQTRSGAVALSRTRPLLRSARTPTPPAPPP